MKPKCPKCATQPSQIKLYGRYYRKSDSRWIRRFHCNHCNSGFSQATFSEAFGQNKRRVNPLVFKLLSSSVSQRRSAKILGVTRTTIKRKLQFLAQRSDAKRKLWLQKNQGQFFNIQFDDLETFEHTKCKPVSVTVVVDADSRKILDYAVGEIPAKGLLAKISRKKYGYRPNKIRHKRKKLFCSLIPIINVTAEFHTDQHKDYPVVLRKYFPRSRHFTYKREEGCVTGQGELKKTKHDPIFMINHTLAMLRANINRLVRRTWCTTKKLSALEEHLSIYIDFHNNVLVDKT